MHARVLGRWLAIGLAWAMAAPAADLNEELLAAVRKSDVAAVRALLEKGADANAKYRYERTVLSFAADRGNLEIVKLLLAKGAGTSVKDTFYGMTPLDAALSRDNIDVAITLLEAGSAGRENALGYGARGGHLALVNAILAKAAASGTKMAQPALDAAMAAAVRTKHDDVVEVLKKAGAAPPPAADFKVEATTLATYAGTYRGAPGDLTFVVKEGKLVGGPPGASLTLGAIDKVTFRPADMDGIVVKFQVEGDKVTGLAVTQSGGTITFKRVEPGEGKQ